MEKGYIHLYTGPGKGKTTAAIGLAIRAAGAGLRVYIGQFIKGMKYSEMEILEPLAPRIVVKQFGRDCFITKEPDHEDVALARNGLAEIKKIMQSNAYDLVILDEITLAPVFKLFPESDLLALIEEKPVTMELVITGRYASERLFEKADLVTDMQEIKHYYTKGVQARDGIER